MDRVEYLCSKKSRKMKLQISNFRLKKCWGRFLLYATVFCINTKGPCPKPKAETAISVFVFQRIHFPIVAVRLFLFRHGQNALGSSWQYIVVFSKQGWRRERSRELRLHDDF